MSAPDLYRILSVSIKIGREEMSLSQWSNGRSIESLAEELSGYAARETPVFIKSKHPGLMPQCYAVNSVIRADKSKGELTLDCTNNHSFDNQRLVNKRCVVIIYPYDDQGMCSARPYVPKPTIVG